MWEDPPSHGKFRQDVLNDLKWCAIVAGIGFLIVVSLSLR
jgi:hypothetical protein